MDFFKIVTEMPKRANGTIKIYPSFVVGYVEDIMSRGGDFYAVWNEELGLWSKNELDVCKIIDKALREKKQDYKEFDSSINVAYMSVFETNSWNNFLKYVMKLPDNSHDLDDNLTFADTKVGRSDYASKRLPYSLSNGPCPAWDELVGTLYEPSERQKIEWAIGSIVSGDSKYIQKFLVFYGDAGSGKSTILHIIEKLFKGYCATFEAKALASNNNSFALESFRDNPLVAIQHDGDLSRIEDNTKINSIVSHEDMVMNEKFKKAYSKRFNCMLFMGTNKPVKISDAKSGIIRRLIDVNPSGKRIAHGRYLELMKQIEFELGAIANHCLKVYKELGENCYDKYRPLSMMYKTDYFFNFMNDNYLEFVKEDGISLERAWTIYKKYCDDVNFNYKLNRPAFREELRNYFYKHYPQKHIDGHHYRDYFMDFKKDLFIKQIDYDDQESEVSEFIFDDSELDVLYSQQPAQYEIEDNNGTRRPKYKWDNVKTTLKDIDTSEVHYVKIPENHIVIDFDLKNADGEKDQELNLKEIQKWPATYGEFSKGGSGIHLHYIYDGDPDKLSNVFDKDIEIKTAKNPIRRRVSKCNNLPIATISSGLPLKEGKKVLDHDIVQNENGIRTLIKKNLNKEYHPGTKPSIDFIGKILHDAYDSGVPYDVTDLRNAVLAFASNSSNHPEYCIKLVNDMPFKSEEASSGGIDADDGVLIFYDVEVFPNLFLVNWKAQGQETVTRMINPTPEEIGELTRFKLVGFNCRRYDNHIMYGRYIGYTNEQLYNLSQRIINKDPNAFFMEAYNLSYTDVYDFSSKKQTLKKWEIELGIHHQELGLPWDEPVDESLWVKVAEYCDNDVIATEAVFNHCSADWTARQILAELANGSVNDTTNKLTQKIIFGNNKKPQGEFNYRNLAEPVMSLDEGMLHFLEDAKPEMVDNPFGEACSILPYFPGYKFVRGKSTYRGEEVGEGGYVYAEPGIYRNVALLDIASMHPSSIIDECLFGVKYTTRFKQLVDARVAFKHEDWGEIDQLLDGALVKFAKRVQDGQIKSSELAYALKIAINSIYGLTASNYDVQARDKRNKDNIVAKRGALFMIDLKHEVQKRGYTVAHIKTDSIKIPNADQEIIDFVFEFGQKYGYTFEHEATYDRMCLVNNAVYIAKYKDGDWTATGAQFAQPYVYKTLFSKEPIVFKDLCETKTVSKGDIYLDMNEKLPEDEHNYIFVGRAGSFCPILPGKGGGELVRYINDGYSAVTGSKGYRWLEAETVEELGKEQDVDHSYHLHLVDEAINDISKYGDFEEFVKE